GVATRDASAALAIGAIVMFAAGVLIVPFVVVGVWPALPGGATGVRAALTKGALCGVALWVVWGVILPFPAGVDALLGDPSPRPGVFAFRDGLLAAVWLLVTQLAYGLAVAVIGAMGHGIAPVETLGWSGYRHAEPPDVTPLRP